MKRFDQFEYDENTLLHILNQSMESAFRYQIENNSVFGEHIDREEQKRLDEGRKIANVLFHLDFAEGMGLMKSVVHSTEQNPLDHDVNGQPICVSTYRITYRGMRYLKYSKVQRWLVRNHHEFMPIIAILGIAIAWLSLLVSIWIQ